MDLNISISDLDKLSGEDFEEVISLLLDQQGYTAIELTPKTCDFGADIIANDNGSKCAIQIKRSLNPIGISAIQEVLGGMAYYRADKGLVVTNAFFTPSAIELAARASISLIERNQIKEWLQSAKISSPQIITPHSYQENALNNLRNLRDEGKTRALVVMASGLGKTYLSALDAYAFQTKFEKPIRVLYLSHQGIILDQAMKSFKNVFGNNRSYGRFDGEARQQNLDLVFATFQSVYKSLDLFDPYSYEYIVIDEAHHTAAPTRDEVVSHFKARFTLGLTATPMRGDGKDIYTYYDDTVAVSLPLEKAIAENLLTPIDYHIVSDKINSEALPQLLKSFVKGRKEINFSPRNDVEIVSIVEQEARKLSKNPKIIVFCASLAQMDYFSSLFKDCKTISGRNNRKKQIEIIELFTAGKFPVLLARDVLNEGVDVPDANMLVFLRNTESPTVFLQQLGRGLRKAANKEKVLVLDFISNIDRFDFIYSFFSRLEAEQSTYKIQDLTYDNPLSSLTLDQTARDIISTLIRKKEGSGVIVEIGSLVATFDYKINIATIKRLIEIGKLIPDFSFTDERGRKKEYLERPTLSRFMRQVHSTRYLEGLMPERAFARLLKQDIQWIKRQEKYGQLAPSWFHIRPNGKIDLYFSDQDIQKGMTLLSREDNFRKYI